MESAQHTFTPFEPSGLGGYIRDPEGRMVAYLNERFITREEANRIGNLLCSALNGRVRP